jgi:hypothetical protein
VLREPFRRLRLESSRASFGHESHCPYFGPDGSDSIRRIREWHAVAIGTKGWDRGAEQETASIWKRLETRGGLRARSSYKSGQAPIPRMARAPTAQSSIGRSSSSPVYVLGAGQELGLRRIVLNSRPIQIYGVLEVLAKRFHPHTEERALYPLLFSAGRRCRDIPNERNRISSRPKWLQKAVDRNKCVPQGDA